MPKIGWKKEVEAMQEAPRPLPLTSLSEERTEQLAICLFDLDRVDPSVYSMLIRGKLEAKPIRMDEQKPEETAVLFTCPLLDAAVTCDLLRSHDRETGDPTTRIWLRKSKEHSWIKQPTNALFSIVDERGLRLHPWTFPPPAAQVATSALKPEKMF